MRNHLVVFLFLSTLGYSQEKNIIGLVHEHYGLVLSNAVIVNLKNKQKTKTNFDGEFNINASVGDTLLAKFEDGKCLLPVKTKVKNLDTKILITLLSNEDVKHQKCLKVPTQLFVFVGKQLKIKDTYPPKDECGVNLSTTTTFTFRVKDSIYGSYPNSVLDFSYSHTAILRSLKTRNALVFTKDYCGKSNHQFMGYINVYKTKNKRWAKRYSSLDSIAVSKSQLIPQIIDFKRESFKVRRKFLERAKEIYKEPYYENKGRRFYPKMGYYVEDYFEYWKSKQENWIYSN